MNIVLKTYPPNIRKIREVFGELPKGMVFCYGNIIYAPDSISGMIDPFLMKHEQTHSKQQAEIGRDKWWELYLKSTDFRISQEVSAFQNQYKEGKKYIKDRNQLSVWLVRLARELSSDVYGNILTFQDALDAIRLDKLYKFDIDLRK